MESLSSSSSSPLQSSSVVQFVDLLTWVDPDSNPDSSASYQKPSLKVSSVLNKNKKIHGPNKMIDGLEDTCWNSEGSQSNLSESQLSLDAVQKVDPQTVTINFHRDVQINSLQIMFQGGFVGLEIDVEYEEKGPNNNIDSIQKKICKLEPEDNNELQHFPLRIPRTSKIKLSIDKFSDFYGRVTIYHLKVLGIPI